MKKLIVLGTACIIATLMPTVVAAQCGGGINTGGGNCTPPTAPGMPAYDSGTGSPITSPSHVKWNDSWGAVAVDEESGSAGMVVQRSSKKQAEADSLNQCAERGGQDCKVIGVYRNQCVAVAWGSTGYALLSGPDEDDIRDGAMERCKRNSINCKVVYAECSDAQRAN